MTKKIIYRDFHILVLNLYILVCKIPLGTVFVYLNGFLIFLRIKLQISFLKRYNIIMKNTKYDSLSEIVIPFGGPKVQNYPAWEQAHNFFCPKFES